MQNINNLLETDRVDGALCIATVVINDLQYVRAAKASQWLGKGRLEAELCLPKCAAHPASNFLRKLTQVIFAASNPAHRLGLVIAEGLH